MIHGSLFSGIGGFDLAAEWMGWDNVFHVERDPFCQQVLRHHFPKSESYEDIKEFDGTAYAGRVDIISGGFPCQPFSAAGKRAGTSDDRYLWPQMFRVIREARPTYVVAENVRGLLSWNDGLVLDTVCSDLEGEGYEVFPVVLPAASVNAPHRRDRIWIVAYRDDGLGKQSHQEVQPRGDAAHDGRSGSASDSNDKGGAGELCQAQRRQDNQFNAEPVEYGATRPADAANADAVRLQLSQNAGEVGRRQSEVRRQGHQPTEPVEATRAAGDATNANGEERQRRSSTGERERQKAEQGRHGVQCAAARPCQESDAPNANGAGARQDHEQRESGQPHQTRAATDWQDFPTVAPVCGGDDGLPTRLDGITFSKWRRESIKAYGNAIVPQVALQIFRAIEQRSEGGIRV